MLLIDHRAHSRGVVLRAVPALSESARGHVVQGVVDDVWLHPRQFSPVHITREKQDTCGSGVTDEPLHSILLMGTIVPGLVAVVGMTELDG